MLVEIFINEFFGPADDEEVGGAGGGGAAGKVLRCVTGRTMMPCISMIQGPSSATGRLHSDKDEPWHRGATAERERHNLFFGVRGLLARAGWTGCR